MLNIFGTKMEVELPDIIEEIFEKDENGELVELPEWEAEQNGNENAPQE